MTLSEESGLCLRASLATLFSCIAVWETFQNGFLRLHVLLWWAAAAIVVLAVVKRVQIHRDSRD